MVTNNNNKIVYYSSIKKNTTHQYTDTPQDYESCYIITHPAINYIHQIRMMPNLKEMFKFDGGYSERDGIITANKLT